jgi:hypothetical protein
MATVKNVELWWTKVDPKKPVKSQEEGKPDYWEVQLRTTDKKAALDWAKKNVKFKPLKRTILDDDGEPVLDEMGEEQKEIVTNDEGKPYFAYKVRRKVKFNDDGTPKKVNVVGGDLSEIKPNSIGNGSVANVRLFQYDYEYQGKKGIANVLMAIQVTKLLEYVSEADEDEFDIVDMEIVKADSTRSSSDAANDLDDEIPF